jgi:hypothetical protein
MMRGEGEEGGVRRWRACDENCDYEVDAGILRSDAYPHAGFVVVGCKFFYIDRTSPFIPTPALVPADIWRKEDEQASVYRFGRCSQPI